MSVSGKGLRLVDHLVSLNTLWIGEELHPIHQLCLLSAIRQGHAVRLFCYGPVRGVPAEVEVVSAEEVLPRTTMFVHAKTGSPAPFADRFRLKLIEKGFGVWIDTDMLFVRPLSIAAEHIFGWENDRLVGNAILCFDKKCAAFKMLVDAIDDDYFIPPWFASSSRFYYSSMKILGAPRHVRHMPYGTTGPDLLTWWIGANALQKQVLPREVFYALPYERKFEVFSGTSNFLSLQSLPRETVAIHLWFQGLAGGLRAARKSSPLIPAVEPGSLLHQVAKELDIRASTLVGH